MSAGAGNAAARPGVVYHVDASYFIFRAYHSMPPDMVDADGNATQALYGFARFLSDLLERTLVVGAIIRYGQPGRFVMRQKSLAAVVAGPSAIIRAGITRILGPSKFRIIASASFVDEQFLTLAPQIAGRDAGDGRLGMVMGKQFAPNDPLWGTLIDVRRGSRHLFLRYSFPESKPTD